MSNFNFLSKEFPGIQKEASQAEKYTFTEPRFSALLSRSALEKAIFWLYENDVDLELPYDTKLGALMHHQDFKDILKPTMHRELDVIRLTGNNAAHGKKVTQYEALQSIKNLFRFLSFISVYYSAENPEVPSFNESLIPQGKETDENLKELRLQTEKLQAELERVKKEALISREAAKENVELKERLQEKESRIKHRKEARKKTSDPDEVIPPLTSEAETRKQLIDLLLREAGWDDLKQGRDLEFEVSGMPLYKPQRDWLCRLCAVGEKRPSPCCS